MALLSVLFGSGSKRTRIERTVAGSLSAFVLDATVREDFIGETELTVHPVENGADITDHVILKPKQLTIEGIVTATPFSVGGQIQGITSTIGAKVGEGLGNALRGGLGKAVGGVAGGIAGGLAGKTVAGLLGVDGDRSLNDVVNELVALRDSKQAVTIQTGLTQYRGYILTRFKIDRDTTTGGSIRVSLGFQELLLARTRTEFVSVPKIKSALGMADLGQQNLKDVTGDKAGKGSSFANNILFGGQ